MKRIVTFSITNDGRKKIQSISIPMNNEDIDSLTIDDNVYGVIDGDFVEPIVPKEKKLIMYYNDETHTVDFEYLPINFNDLSAADKLVHLKDENENLISKVQELNELNKTLNNTIEDLKASNESLKSELELTQLSIFDVVDLVLSE